MPDWVVFLVAFVLLATVVPALVLVMRRLEKKRNELDRKRFEVLIPQRSGKSIDTFRAAFEGAQIPAEIVEGVYRIFDDSVSHYVPGFAILPEDDFEEVYRIDGDDLEDEVRRLLERLGRRFPKTPGKQVKTVFDLVHFVAECPPKYGRGSKNLN